MKALTKPEKFQAMSRIYGYEGEWDVDEGGYYCEFVGYTDDNEEIWECVSTCEAIFDCDDC